MRSRSSIVLCLTAALLLTGCTNYYKVTDPASGRTYYTTEVERERRSTTIQFKDAKSGSEVTLPASEIKEISKEAYKSAVETK